MFVYRKVNKLIIMLSTKIVIVAISAGILTAICSSTIDSLFSIFVIKKNTENIIEVVKRCLLSGCIGGFLVSIVFCYFASVNALSMRMIIVYSIIIGIAVPTLSNFLTFMRLKLFN